jgi:hypothetical protein
MIMSKEIFLKKLVKLPELADNTVAFIFANNPDIDISIKETFFENIISSYKTFKKKKPEISQFSLENVDGLFQIWKGKDLRIKNIKLNSVRGFPQSDKPFGIDFTDVRGEPQSMIILGSNATGKSSIFDAVEYCYCDSIGEALLRAYKEGEESDYRFMHFLEHNENGQSKIFCNVITKSDIFDIKRHEENIPKQIRDKINPNTYFISDYDIYITGQLDYKRNTKRSFHNMIAQCLGFTELLEFEKCLNAFSFYRRQAESRTITGYTKSIDNYKNLVTSNINSIKDKKKTLEKLTIQQVDSTDDNKIKVSIDLINKVKQNPIQTKIHASQFSSKIDKFYQTYEKIFNKNMNKIIVNEIQFLNVGLELIKEHADCPFCQNSKLSIDSIIKNVYKRIDRLKELNHLTELKNIALNEIIDFIESLKNQVEVFRSRITNEINLIKDKTEFNELLLLDNSFLINIEHFIADDCINQLFNFNNNSIFIKDKDFFIIEHLRPNLKYSEITINNLINLTDEFNISREKIIHKIELYIAQSTQPQSLTEKIICLNKEIDDLTKQISEANTNITKDSEKIDEIYEQINLFNEVKKDTAIFSKFFHNALNEEINKSFAPIKMIIEEVLESYFKLDNRNIDLVISKEIEEYDQENVDVPSEIITAQIRIKNKDIKLQPVNRYLNNFHYRLFSTMVRISIAIASRINTQVNLPLVLDDVFYASDFENRLNIEIFFKQIFEIFKKYTPNLPLQIILFTHDQNIFESAIKIINEIDKMDIAFAKLFTFEEAQDEGDYLNLIYLFPHYLPNSIMKSLSAKV